MIYTVAHELAHVFLGHGGHFEFYNSAESLEINADEKVIAWGFEKELRDSSFNYIYGTGLENFK